ncbi:MAG: hypothetical protein ACLQUT_06450 [Thermoleophilia bacterium]
METKTTALPEFSQKVFNTLYEMLRHQDYGFSETTAEELAEALGVSEQAIGGAIAHLVDRDLVNVEDWCTTAGHYHFLHINVLDELAL